MKYSCYQESSVIHGWFVYWVFGWEIRRLSKSEIRFRMASFSFSPSVLDYPASRGYIFAVWAGVRKVASADNRSIFYRACAKFVTRFAIHSQATGSSNLREFRGNQTCENYLRTTLLELLFCFSASPLLVLTILAAKFPRIVFFRKVFLCYQL